MLDPVLPSFFRNCSQAKTQEYLGRARTVSYRPGDFVWRRNDLAPDLIVVQSGCLSVVSPGESGQGTHRAIIALIAGDCLVRALTDIRPSNADVVALVPTQALLLPTALFREQTPDSFQVRLGLAEMLQNHLKESWFWAHSLRAMPVVSRLSYILWRLSSAGPSSSRIVPFKIPSESLSDLVGTDRSELSRKKKVLEKQGLIKSHPLGLELSPELYLVATADPFAGDFLAPPKL